MSKRQIAISFLLSLILFSCASSRKEITTASRQKEKVTVQKQMEKKENYIESTPFKLRGDAAFALEIAMKEKNEEWQVGYITRYGIYNGKYYDCSLVSVIRKEWKKKGSSIMNYKICKGAVKEVVSSTNETIPDFLIPGVSEAFKSLKSGREKIMEKKKGYLIEGKRKKGICEVKVLNGIRLLYYSNVKCTVDKF